MRMSMETGHDVTNATRLSMPNASDELGNLVM